MPFHLHRSNRTEQLVAALVRLVRDAPPDPLAAEAIVVQGQGMERWLSMQLARQLGIWANPSFPFPRKLIQQAMSAALGEPDAGAAAFEPESLVWSVAHLLPGLLPLEPFAPLRSYLDGDERGLKRIQLSARVATTLDHYVVYRPDLVRQWERQPGDDWQAMLWRRLVEVHGRHHFAARAERFAEALAGGAVLAAEFPRRVSLFGLSTLPPLYVHLLQLLSARVETHLFLLSPSREYWAEIRSRGDALRRAQRRDGYLPSEEELLLLEGNPLLASLGRLGREFQEVLEAMVDYQDGDDDLYEDPGAGDMLACLQSDILHLAQRRPGAPPPGADDSAFPVPLPLRAGDDSIRIHSCHGPMREVEVLHDQLLALFAADPGLEPADVVVMTPAIDVYAPYVEAVFRRGDGGPPRIPYRIADRSARATEEVGDALFRLLDVLRGRLAASEVLDLLAIDGIRGRHGFSVDDVDVARAWITAAGIRWGEDAAHRQEVGQPAVAENTWRFGLDRLLLGYALPSEERALRYGVLPYDDVEGSESAVLGQLAAFCEQLFRHRRRMRQPHTLPEWREILTALLADMISDTGFTAYQHQQVRDALAAIEARAQRAGFDEAIDLDAVRAELEEELQRGRSARGFLSGGVTFCELVPMRTIPFPVVCLLGMNDGAFPRIRRPLGFDKIAQEPRRGDRSVREDDRYLFLEAVLATRRRLLISFVGQSITDSSSLPPSVVVSELLDTLERSFFVRSEDLEPGEAEPGAVRRRLVVTHPLQPFSPRNFGADHGRLFSYSRADFEGAEALDAARRGRPSPPHSFLGAPLPLLLSAPRQVGLEQLVRFFEHPTRAFLQTRLGLYLGEDRSQVEDREPLELSALAQWQVGDTLLRVCADATEVVAALELVRARGDLPPGALGDAAFAGAARDAGGVLALRNQLTPGASQRLEIDAAVGDTRVTGVVADLWPAGQVRSQFSRLATRRELGYWIRHVILNALAGDEQPRHSYLIGRKAKKGAAKKGDAADAGSEGGVRFTPPRDAKTLAAVLLDLYWRGQEWPLPLFEKSSRAYADVQHANQWGDPAKAWKRAATIFPAGEQPRGEDGDDVNVRQVYGDGATLERVCEMQSRQTLVPAFEEIARLVFRPLLEHREEWP